MVINIVLCFIPNKLFVLVLDLAFKLIISFAMTMTEQLNQAQPALGYIFKDNLV